MSLHFRAISVDGVFRRRVEVNLYEIVGDPIEPDLRSRVRYDLQCAPFLRQDAARRCLVRAAIRICQLHIHDSVVEVDVWWIQIPDRAGTRNVDRALFPRLRRERHAHQYTDSQRGHDFGGFPWRLR